ncbi:MAG: PAS domain-containing protein, partial [Candidatus Thorarchaeota archaeon]
MQITSITSQSKLIEQIKQGDYDCVLSDYQMPIMNGIQLATHIRTFSNIPIILYTGQGSEEVAEQAFTAGINDYIRKEFGHGHIIDLVNHIKNVVERKRSEYKHILSEKRFNTLFNGMQDCVAVYQADEDGNDFVFVDFNQSAASVDKLSREDVLGRKVTEVFPGVKDMGLFEIFKRVWKTGIPEHLPVSLYRDSRFEGWRNNYVYKLPSGEIVSIYRDLTQQVITEHELTVSQELVNKFMDSAPLSIHLYDSELNLIRINDQALKRSGLTRDMVGKNILEISPSVESTGRIEEYKKIIETGTSKEFSEVYELPDGNILYVNIYAFKVSDGLGLIFNDVTEMKLAADHIEYLVRSLTSIRNVNQLIVNEKNCDTLLTETCRLLTQDRAYHNVWIMLQDGKGELIKTYESGLGDKLQPLIKQRIDGELPECSRKALETSEVTIVEDPMVDCVDCPLHETYQNRSALTVRLEHEGTIFGLLTASIPKEMTSEDEISLFSEIAGDISLALHLMNVEEEKRQANWALSERMKEFEGLYQVSKLLDVFGSDINSILEGVVSIINSAFQYPWLICVRLVYGDFVHVSEGFKESEKRLSADITVNGDKAGFIEAFISDGSDAEFLREEVDLVVHLAERLGEFIERIHLDEMRQKSERRFQAFIDSAPDAFQLYDSELHLILTNNRGLRRSNIRDQDIGKHITELSTSIQTSGRYEEYLKVLETGESYETEIVSSNREDDERYISLRAFKVNDGLGIILRDITERKRLEKALAVQTVSLEKVVEAKSEELMVAERMTTAGKIASMIGHDLRSPLQTINNALYLIKQNPEDSNEALALAEEAIQRANHMIEELRNNTRSIQYNPVPTNMDTLITNTIKGTSIPDSVETVKEVDDGLEEVLLDPFMMR